MTTNEKVSKQIDDLINKRNSDLAEITARMEELKAKKDHEQKEQQDAAAVLDEAAFDDATAKLKSLETKIAMYKARLDQIAKQEFISEEESEATIDSLLAYEDELKVAFEKAITPHIDALEKILADYTAEVNSTEGTITRWVSTIRRTFYSRSGSVRVVNGKSTNRFDTPQPVRMLAYTGCKSAGAIRTLLDSVKNSMA